MLTYTITELARESDITPRAIRYYEDERLITPKREGAGGRVRGYAARERTRLKLTLHGKTSEQQREDLDITLAEIAAHEAACQRMLARTSAATDGRRPAPAQSGVAKASRKPTGIAQALAAASRKRSLRAAGAS